MADRPAEMDALRAEYAANCSVVGSPAEAARILDELLKKRPNSVTTLECALWHHLSQYEYDQAAATAEVLRVLQPSGRPLGNVELEEIIRTLRGRHRDSQRAETLIQALLQDESKPRWLRNAACQLRAEKLLYLDRDMEGALNEVKALESRIPGHNSVGLTLMGAMISILLGREVARNRERIRAAEASARAAGNSYSLQGVDAYRAMILGDREAMLRQVFGNSFRGMLDLVRSRWTGDQSFPEFIDWKVTADGWRRAEGLESQVLDLDTGKVSDHGVDRELRMSGLPLRALQVLASDFVAPVRERSLFEALYPGESFTPLSSPMRIHAILGRIRLWASTHRLPLEIEARQRTFRLSSRCGLIFRLRNPLLPRTEGVKVNEDVLTADKALREVFGPRDPITSSDVQKVLNVSLRTSVYRLKGLCEAGRLRSSGRGRATRYWLTGT
jgi:hypothetical protein